ncbi:hypothetical protein A8B78_11825 [Jannaschia sp. EhC01]|nr:hypothetical protein A8B78_11825 [Jannaschia sp. EhC01]
MSGSASLSDSDHAEFEAAQQRFGLTSADLNHDGTLSTDNHNGNLILSADPAISHVEPTIVPYNSLAELKNMVGRADSDFTDGPFSDKHLHYPDPIDEDRAQTLMNTLNECDFDFQATPAELGSLRKSAESYVMGNSQKLKTLEPLLNARFGTGSVAVIAANKLNVGKDQTVTFKADPNDPDKILVLNFTEVTVDEGGQIIVEAPVKMKTVTFTAAD